jgi:hypothetical protein
MSYVRSKVEPMGWPPRAFRPYPGGDGAKRGGGAHGLPRPERGASNRWSRGDGDRAGGELSFPAK